MGGTQTENWLLHDHRHFESTVRECELAAGALDWDAAVTLFNDIADDLKLHMRMEDEVIYPFLKRDAAAIRADIDELMLEHDNLARLLGDLATVIRNRDFDHFEESLTPFYEALIEHNAHEEVVFGKVDSQFLLRRRDEILRLMDAINPAFRREWDF